MKAGIHTDISIGDYHAEKAWISATGLKHAARSMAEFKYYIDGGFDRDGSTEMNFGNAFELALLDQKGFDDQVAIAQTEYWTIKALTEKPDLKRPKQSKVYTDLAQAFERENEGKYLISDVGAHSYEVIEKMMASCYRDKWIQELVKNIQYQNTLCWIDPETQLQMKTRPDICKVTKNVVVNLKTSRDASPDAFSRDLANYDYPLQAVVEIEGVIRTGLMDKVDRYMWLVVETEAPYNAVIYDFDKSEWEGYQRAYRFLLNRIKKYQEADFWPGYTDRADNEYGILTARIPAYYSIYSM